MFFCDGCGFLGVLGSGVFFGGFRVRNVSDGEEGFEGFGNIRKLLLYSLYKVRGFLIQSILYFLYKKRKMILER